MDTDAIELLRRFYNEVRSFGSQMPFSLEEAMGEEGSQVMAEVEEFLAQHPKVP